MWKLEVRKTKNLVFYTESKFRRLQFESCDYKPDFYIWLAQNYTLDFEPPHLPYCQDIEGPIVGKVVTTQKGNLLLVNDPETRVIPIIVPSGYRGTSQIKSVEMTQGSEYFEGKYYHSPLGNLGVSKILVLNLKPGEQAKIRWVRSGRLYGHEKDGLTIVTYDGQVLNYPDDEEIVNS